jgi:hypothetical protein
VKTSVKAPTGPLLVAQTLGLCVATGFAAGWIMPMIAVPFFSCVICYFLGLFAGTLLAKVIDVQMNKVVTIIVFGLLIGMSLSPYGLYPMMIIEILRDSITGQGPGIFAALNAILGSLFSPVGFVVGVLRPTAWRQRW